MENITCKSCHGSVTRVGNYYVCDYCRSKWIIDSSDDVHAVERANAWASLRDEDFEKAAEQFEAIIVKNAKDHEGYWGRALALSRIKYEEDVQEGKKVPTCNNISENSFLKDKDVQKAISLAPDEIKKSYREQAELIDKIRVEYLEIASKEAPYDVFISFKDKDNGVRTQDSIDAQDIYTGLQEAGYRVFFSRVSLMGKVSERYEPYIYNAIKTAKVMIVFGEKPEYFNATWIKNEWKRFRARIDNGEKHKNSLVVVVKNMNPSDLPVALRSRQAMNMDDLTFFETLKKHINRVIEESKKDVHLDKIEIKGGQISKKASKIANESIKIREIGAGATAETSITEKQQISLVKSYIDMKQWEDADKLLEDILFNNPSNADATWLKLLVKHNCQDSSMLLRKASSFEIEDYGLIERTLNCSSKESAAEILNLLYTADDVVDASTYCKILKAILPYDFKGRDARIKEDFEAAITKGRYGVFKILLSTLADNEVDRYIDYHLRFAKSIQNNSIKEACINAILEVENGNLSALELRLSMHWNNSDHKVILADMEEILKYASKPNQWVRKYLQFAAETLSTTEQSLFAKELIRYYSLDISGIKDILLEIANAMINHGFFDHAEYILGLILTVDPDNPEVYWDICLVKTKAKNEKGVLSSNISIKNIPEYTKYLTMVSETRRRDCMALAKKQEACRTNRKKAKKFGVVVLSAIVAFIALIITVAVFQNVIIPSNKYNEAKQLLADGKYLESYDIFNELGDYKDCPAIIEEIKTYAKNKAVEYAGQNDYNNAYGILSSFNISKSEFEPFEIYQSMAEGRYGDAVRAGVTNIVIPNGVTAIPDYAFRGCDTLKSVVIPDSVTKIGERAFNGCSSLTSIDIPDGVTKIGDYAFYGCASITSIVIPDGVTEIGEHLFDACSSLTSIDIPDGVTSIGRYAFSGCTALVSIEIPDSVSEISGYAFDDCTSLENFFIPSGVTSIDSYAFNNCSKLTVLFIPSNVNEINYNAFYGCTNVLLLCSAKSKPSGWNSDWNECSYSTVCSVVWGCGDAAGVTDDGLCWMLTPSGTVGIFGYFGTSSEVKIPSTIEGYTVTVIANELFKNNTNVTRVELPKNLVSIGESAFKGCSNLENIVMPESTVTIGEYAFHGCSKLSSIDIPDGITSIGNYTFYGCSNLASVVIPEGVTSIGNSVFANCSLLTSVNMPDGVTSIGNSAFWGCSSLTSVNIPDSVTSISNSIFNGCSSLASVNIPNGVTSIGYSTFSGCSGLTSVEIPSSVTSIGNHAFSGCTSLSSLTFGEGIELERIGEGAFENCTSLTTIKIPNGITGIAESTFKGCSSLKSVSIPNGVTTIEKGAFDNCSELTFAFIPKSVLTIESYIFLGCEKLTVFCGASSTPTNWNYFWNFCDDYSNDCPVVWGCGDAAGVTDDGLCWMLSSGTVSIMSYLGTTPNVTIPSVIESNPVTTIANKAFYNCKNISSVDIPDSVTTIGNSAFEGCSGLISVVLPKNLVGIGTKAFYNCNKLVEVYDLSATIVVTKGTTDNGYVGYYAHNVLTSADSDSSLFTDSDGFVFFSNGAKYYLIGYTGAEKNIVLPADYEGNAYDIMDYAFYENTQIESVIIPDCVTQIGKYSFYMSNLNSVTLGNGVTAINDSAFRFCSNLSSVTLNDNLQTIGSHSFTSCVKLTSISFGNSLKSIGESAFSNCRLTSVIIPEKVTHIGKSAFYDNKLTSVQFMDTTTWKVKNYSTYTLTSANLSNTMTAAKYLLDTYVFYEWTKS